MDNILAAEQKRREVGLAAGLDTKDCPLARDNQIWLSDKQIFMPTCLTDNQIFHIFVDV
jgi:hypothetical protein